MIFTFPKHLLLFGLILIAPLAFAQNYWQQRADYQMEVDFDVNTHRYTGKQVLTYTNNSPDTLERVFYHLYFNAFQPGSMMDVRSRTIEDPDRRVGSRIFQLSENEIGYLRVKSLSQDGKTAQFAEVGTILEVQLAQPILPGKSTSFEMDFEGQVPLQIRRSGRDNEEGISYSMVQWYPKMCEYDNQGWHANPYIGREFYGVWGDFDVKLTIDKDQVVAASGYLQNPEEVGHGYPTNGKKVKQPKGDKLTWHFVAPEVHDFMWAADPDFEHVVTEGPNGLALHFFYQKDSLTENWEMLPEYTSKAFAIMNERFGKYPYKKYSVIQGGDGGMEYAMGTLITGHRSLGSLVGVTVHELIHSWYQFALATNESLYPWMDEGFTSYASNIVMNELFPGRMDALNVHSGSYRGYYSLVASGKEEPMSTHSDHYKTNRAYGSAAYSKGAVFVHQLGYIIGQQQLEEGMRRYYYEWKMKHPKDHDFIRVMEKVSGLELDWYLEYFAYTTKTIDYAIEEVLPEGESTMVELTRKGDMIMPIEVLVQYTDGSQELFYTPLEIMRGAKPEELEVKRTLLPDWPWVYPNYRFTIPKPYSEVQALIIDPTGRLADVEQENNVWTPQPDEVTYKVDE